MLAGAGRRLHAPHPLALDDQPDPLAGGRARILPRAVRHGDPAALHPHLARRGSGSDGGHLLPAADGFLDEAGLGAEHRRLSDARAGLSMRIAAVEAVVYRQAVHYRGATPTLAGVP